MITKETAKKLSFCYQEIEDGEELLGRLEKKIASGHLKYCQLCVSLDENPDEIFEIDLRIVRSVIRAHVAEKKKELARADTVARDEWCGLKTPPGQQVTINPEGSVLGECQIEPDDVIGPGEISISRPVDTRPTGS